MIYFTYSINKYFFNVFNLKKEKKNDKNYIIPLNNSDNIKLSYINFNFFLEFPYTKCILCMVISNVVYIYGNGRQAGQANVHVT